MLEIEALVEGWERSGLTRLLVDADQAAMDPRLALAGKEVRTRPGRKIFSRSGAQGSSAEERFAMAYHASRREILLFGGSNGTTLLRDTWSLKYWAP